jgi:hypothetical protein
MIRSKNEETLNTKYDTPEPLDSYEIVRVIAATQEEKKA